ncbi:golgin subfamily A member 6-like protein 7 isoform X2 [Branchiostoma lanceolatum]|uniref:golgin subfamily A member 6-like protein 7 isoform X2 n=1 Tax=Branchiostoma lanceolatum TaxID=7740 RepID=UPI0034559D4A
MTKKSKKEKNREKLGTINMMAIELQAMRSSNEELRSCVQSLVENAEKAKKEAKRQEEMLLTQQQTYRQLSEIHLKHMVELQEVNMANKLANDAMMGALEEIAQEEYNKRTALEEIAQEEGSRRKEMEGEVTRVRERLHQQEGATRSLEDSMRLEQEKVSEMRERMGTMEDELRVMEREKNFAVQRDKETSMLLNREDERILAALNTECQRTDQWLRSYAAKSSSGDQEADEFDQSLDMSENIGQSPHKSRSAVSKALDDLKESNEDLRKLVSEMHREKTAEKMATQEARKEKEKLSELYDSEKEKEMETMRKQFVQNTLEAMKENEEKIIFQYTTMLNEEKTLSSKIRRERDELSGKVWDLETQIEILKAAKEHGPTGTGEGRKEHNIRKELKGEEKEGDDTDKDRTDIHSRGATSSRNRTRPARQVYRPPARRRHDDKS